MLNFTSRTTYYLSSTPTDMRNGREGLAGIIREKMQRDPYSYDEAFIFYSKDYRKVKILHYDINGFVLYQKGKKDMWVVRLFFYQKQEVYCKEYKIARFNVPGSDPQSSKYPQSIIKGNPLMPSFCRFYLESKFAYHLSENRLLDMLSQISPWKPCFV